MHGLALWFDAHFFGPDAPAAGDGGDGAGGDGAGPCSARSEIVLRTGPDAPPTHWMQTVSGPATGGSVPVATVPVATVPVPPCPE